MHITDSYGFLFSKAAQRLQESLAPSLEDAGLNAKQIGLLFIVAGDPGITQKAAGEVQRIDRTSVMQMVDSLEARGLVERRKSEADRRSNALFLTGEGEELADRLGESVKAAQDEILAPIGEKKAKELKRMLLALTEGEDDE